MTYKVNVKSWISHIFSDLHSRNHANWEPSEQPHSSETLWKYMQHHSKKNLSVTEAKGIFSPSLISTNWIIPPTDTWPCWNKQTKQPNQNKQQIPSCTVIKNCVPCIYSRGYTFGYWIGFNMRKRNMCPLLTFVPFLRPSSLCQSWRKWTRRWRIITSPEFLKVGTPFVSG